MNAHRLGRYGALAGLLGALQAEAAEPPREEHRVDFEAKEVEISGTESELSLRGEVVVRSERFQLTADQVTLSRSSRGVHVEGAGRLAFCPCKSPPLTLGFSAADLAPPTDVLLEHATLRLFGVPFFYWPYLWLRAPTRFGVFPPRFEYRGEEGVYLATGVHWPIRQQGNAELSVVDLEVGGYVEGGARVTLSAWGSAGHAEFGWDYFDGSVWRGRADFATTLGGERATVAGSIRALRGVRAFVQPSRVTEVALAMDRARFGVARTDAGPLVALSLIGSAPRGSLMRARPTFGPLFELGDAIALSERSTLDFSVEGDALLTDTTPVTTTSLRAGLRSSPATGPVLMDLYLRGRGRALAEEEGSRQSFDGESRVRLALPLARRFGELVHRVDPVVEGAVGLRRSHGAARDGFDEGGFPERGTLLAGVESALGTPREAVDLRLMGGVSGELGAPEGVLATRVRAGLRGVAFDTEARALPGSRAVEFAARSRLGIPGVAELGLYAQGRRGATEALRRLFASDFTRPDIPWLSVNGVSAGASLLVPLGFGLESEVGADYDVSRERFLGGSGSLAYRHACGCLAVALWGSKRLGRDDYDLAFRVDLVP